MLLSMELVLFCHNATQMGKRDQLICIQDTVKGGTELFTN